MSGPPTTPRAPFVASVRSRPGVLRLGGAGDAVITVRVELPAVWDTVRVEVPPSEPVVGLKVRALEALYPEADYHEDFVMKLHGFEVKDENLSIAAAGATRWLDLSPHAPAPPPGPVNAVPSAAPAAPARR